MQLPATDAVHVVQVLGRRALSAMCHKSPSARRRQDAFSMLLIRPALLLDVLRAWVLATVSCPAAVRPL